jgi:hypothetical protein
VTQPELPEGYAPTGQETEEELAELKVESLREIEMDDMVELFQRKFAFDSEPTAESGKPVTSAGIKTALDAADAKIGELKENLTGLQELADTKAAAIYETASGAIASFSDGADDMQMKSCVVKMEPVQDLHGYDHPWPAGGGKNKFNPQIYNNTISGVNIVSDGSGKIVFSGTSTEAFWFRVDRGGLATPELLVLPSGEYIISASGIPSNQVYVRFNDGADHDLTVNNPSYTFTSDGTMELVINVRVQSDVAFGSGTSISIMIRLATEADGTFAPYENICPISGRTMLNVIRTGRNLLNPIRYNTVPRIHNGITFTLTDDGGIQAKGTATAQARFYFYNNSSESYSMDAILSCKGATADYALYSDVVRTVLDGDNKPLAANTVFGSMFLYVPSGVTVDAVVYPMIRPATITDPTFESYTAKTITIDLGGTRYGGTLDVVSGKLTVDRYYALMDGLTWIKQQGYPEFRCSYSSGNIPVGYFVDNATVSDIVCSIYKAESVNNTYRGSHTGISVSSSYLSIGDSSVSDIDMFNAIISGQQIAYKIATPFEVQLTPQEVRTLLGVNNIWSDAGDVTSEYPADTKMYIDTKIAEAVAAALA